MPTQEAPSYSSSRVQRASRLNTIEQARLHQKLMLLEKARLHQIRLTNQDIRLTSIGLDYIQACSGHSPEGRGPSGQQGSVETASSQTPCFVYGERVTSRKMKRVVRPHSAMDRSAHYPRPSDDEIAADDPTKTRPQSSPAKGRSWGFGYSGEQTEGNKLSNSKSDTESHISTPGISRPSTATAGLVTAVMGFPGTGTGRHLNAAMGFPASGRVAPHQSWEDDTDEVTKKLLKLKQQQQQPSSQRRPSLYLQDLDRVHSQTASASRSLLRQSRGTALQVAAVVHQANSVGSASRSGYEDKKPVPPHQKRARSGSHTLDRRAGLSEIMNQARGTKSASAWRAHLAKTQNAPKSTENQTQELLEARKNAAKLTQHYVEHKIEQFMGQLPNNGR